MTSIHFCHFWRTDQAHVWLKYVSFEIKSDERVDNWPDWVLKRMRMLKQPSVTRNERLATRQHSVSRVIENLKTQTPASESRTIHRVYDWGIWMLIKKMKGLVRTPENSVISYAHVIPIWLLWVTKDVRKIFTQLFYIKLKCYVILLYCAWISSVRHHLCQSCSKIFISRFLLSSLKG